MGVVLLNFQGPDTQPSIQQMLSEHSSVPDAVLGPGTEQEYDGQKPLPTGNQHSSSGQSKVHHMLEDDNGTTIIVRGVGLR